MKEVALVTLLTEQGVDLVLEAYLDFDKAHERVADLILLSGDNGYYTQYVELK